MPYEERTRFQTLVSTQNQSSSSPQLRPSTMSDGDVTPKPLTVRRQRQHGTIPRTARYRHENAPLPPAEPNTHINEGRGAVTSSVVVQSPTIVTQSNSEVSLRRQPSLKHRLLNRMVSGFSSKPVIHGVSDLENAALTRQSSHDHSRQSSESSNSNARSLFDLDGALAVFPTPPTSQVTTPKTERSFQSIPSPVQTQNGLSVPQKLGTLAAEIKVFPCHDRERLDYSNAAVIKINAKISGDSPGLGLQSQMKALDVVVVIDNS